MARARDFYQRMAGMGQGATEEKEAGVVGEGQEAVV